MLISEWDYFLSQKTDIMANYAKSTGPILIKFSLFVEYNHMLWMQI